MLGHLSHLQSSKLLAFSVFRIDVRNLSIQNASCYMKSWLNVLVFLKGIMVGFAVFVGGVVYVMKRLAAFFLALLIILLAFAQIFWTIFRMTAYDYGSGGCTSNTSAMAYIVEPDPPQEVCDYQNENECVTPEPELCEPENNEPWCR